MGGAMLHFRPVTTWALFRQAWANATIAERIDWALRLVCVGPFAIVIFLLVVFAIGQFAVFGISEISQLIRWQ